VCAKRRLSKVYLVIGYKACRDKKFDECAESAARARAADPTNTAAKQLSVVASLQGGTHDGIGRRDAPGFQTGLHRLSLEVMLFPLTGGSLMHLTALRYNKQMIDWPILFRIGAAGALGQIQQYYGDFTHLAATTEPTISLGKEWGIRKYGAFDVMGEITGGALYAGGRFTYIVRPRLTLELSYGRLSTFFGIGFMRHGLFRGSDDSSSDGETSGRRKVNIDLSVSFGISIGLGK
jgi:hypothetical protein